MNRILDMFWDLTPAQAAVWLTGINVAMLVVAVAAGEVVVRLFRDRAVTPPPDPLDRREILLSISAVALNTIVGFAGWVFWKRGLIVVRRSSDALAIALNVLVLLLAMDLLMYV